jgi:hypothetical protein
MYCGTFGNGLYKSYDGFNNSTNIRPGNLAIADINIDPLDSAKVFISEVNLDDFSFGLYYSDNGGSNFSLILPALVNMIYNSPDSDSLFTATEDGIYISPDNGANWVQLYSGFSFTAIKQHHGIVYAGLKSGELIKAYPQFEDISGNWGTAVAKTILFKDDILYYGLSGAEQDTAYSLHGGVWYSRDFGTSWQNMTGNLSTTHCFGNPGLAFSNGQLLMASYSGGVFKTSQVTNSSPDFHHDLSYVSVYPNPTRGSIQIQVKEHLKNADLKIYNSSGQMEKIISDIDGNSVQLAIQELEKGMHFILLQDAERQFTGRFMVE